VPIIFASLRLELSLQMFNFFFAFAVDAGDRSGSGCFFTLSQASIPAKINCDVNNYLE